MKAFSQAVIALALLAAPAFAAPPLPSDPRAAKAVQDYLRAQQAETLKDRQTRVADRMDALANAPGSPVMGNPKGKSPSSSSPITTAPIASWPNRA